MSANRNSETPVVGVELLALVSISLKTLELHLTDADPKIALRAVAEMTKLLGVCARNGIPIENGTPAATSPASTSPPKPTPPSAPIPASVAKAMADLAAEMEDEFEEDFDDILEDDFDDDSEVISHEKTSPIIVPTFTREPDIVLPPTPVRNPLRSPILTSVPDARAVPNDRPVVPLPGAPVRLTDCLKLPIIPRSG